MKPKLWKNGDVLKVIENGHFLIGTLVEFQNWLTSNGKYAVVVKTTKSNKLYKFTSINRDDLELVSRPGIPFKIGQKVQLTKESHKQAIVVGFGEWPNGNKTCILDRKLNSEILWDDSQWGIKHLSLVTKDRPEKEVSYNGDLLEMKVKYLFPVTKDQPEKEVLSCYNESAALELQKMLNQENIMKPELWLKGDLLKMNRKNNSTPTIVEFQELGPNNGAVIKKGSAPSYEKWVSLNNLELVSRPGIPFEIGQKVQLTQEPNKQATVVGFGEWPNGDKTCILDRKLNYASQWGTQHLSLVKGHWQNEDSQVENPPVKVGDTVLCIDPGTTSAKVGKLYKIISNDDSVAKEGFVNGALKLNWLNNQVLATQFKYVISSPEYEVYHLGTSSESNEKRPKNLFSKFNPLRLIRKVS